MKPKPPLCSAQFSLKSLIAFLVMVSAPLVGAQTLQTLCLFDVYIFNNGASVYPNGLTLGNDGNFYGTTDEGGSSGFGTVFKVTTNGLFTPLVSFNGNNGAYPQAALTLGSDGSFYGTTVGGDYYNGTVFRVTPDGTLTTLLYISNEQRPEAALTLGRDGNFYGTTYGGGLTGLNNGTVFKFTTLGAMTTLVSFNGSNGMYPSAALTLGRDGNFYGTTYQGGNTNLHSGYGWGTIFRVTTNGTLTTLVSFNFTNGANPEAALTLGNDGNFYGTTDEGGTSGGNGTVFKMTPNGELSTLYSFSGYAEWSPNGLTLGNDGNFYGTTSSGGAGLSGYGTVFKVTTNGTLTTLVSFANTNGAGPGDLTLGNDGSFYGTTSDGSGSYIGGTVFRLVFPPAITAQPSGQRVLLGNNVSFNVSVIGTTPFHYQWRFNNSTNISNATNVTYSIQTVDTNNTGSYSVTINNSVGGVASSNALLTVIVPPTVALQCLAGYPVLNLNGMLSNNFVVQYSTNLSGTNWINLRSVTNLLTDPYLFADPAGIVPPGRFYRAVMQ